MEPLLTSWGKTCFFFVNVTFPFIKFRDLLEIKITLRYKNIPNRFYLVKDSLIRYPVQPVRDTSDLTSHAQYVEDFLKKYKSSLFQIDIKMDTKKSTKQPPVQVWIFQF